MYRQLLALTGLTITALVSNAVAQFGVPEMVYDCNVTPGVCSNMCWGAYCAGYDVSLTHDKPSNKVRDDRRAKAGCGKNNRCKEDSPDPDGKSCDEYPFASVIDADSVQQVNRCVPKSEQDSTSLLPSP